MSSFSQQEKERDEKFGGNRRHFYTIRVYIICILSYNNLNAFSLRFENCIHSEESALCIDMLTCNTILSSCLAILIAQTSFYILIGNSEIGLQAASAAAEIFECCSHVQLPNRRGLAMQVSEKNQNLHEFRVS